MTVAPAFAQTPNSIQIPYVNTYSGIPAGSSQTLCATAIGGDNKAAPGVGDNCIPTQATLSSPQAVVIDPKTGNVFIADSNNNEIRVVYQSGATELAAIVAGYNNSKVLTSSSVIPGRIYNHCGEYAGATTSITSAGGSCGITAVHPIGLAIDPGGNLLDSEGSSRMRMAYVGGSQGAALITATTGQIGPLKLTVGYEYPIMYSSLQAYYGDGGPAILALTHTAKGIAMDANEDVYIADSGNNAIRYINGITGIISTIAGSNAGSPCTLGTVTAFVAPVAGYKSPPSAIGTAGGCPAGLKGDNGPALSAELSAPADVILDAKGNLYIADFGNARVRVLYNGNGTVPGVANPVAGSIYTVVGGGTLTAGGQATQILLKSAGGLGFDAAGNLYIADTTGGKIWEVDAKTNIATVIVGGGASAAIGTVCSSSFPGGPVRSQQNGDGCLGTVASLTAPAGRISFDAAGNLYVADSTAGVIRVLSKAVPPVSAAVHSSVGIALAFAPLAAITPSSASFSTQGIATGDFSDAGGSTCDATTALAAGQLCYLNVAFSPTLPGLREGAANVSTSASKLFGSNFISGVASGAEIALDSAVQTTVGTGLAPASVIADPSGAIYIADKTSGSVLRYASATATKPSALITGLSSPGQVTLDGQGDVLVADTGNNRVAIYAAIGGTVSYLTGFASPQGVTVDGQDNIYVADTGNNQIVQVSASGVSTIVTTGLSAPSQLSLDGSGNVYAVEGNGTLIELPGGTGAPVVVPTGNFVPIAVGIDAANDLYVLDKTGKQVGFISAQGNVTTTPLTGLISPAGLSIDSFANIYVADAGATGAYALNRQQVSTSFFPENIGQTSTFSSFVLTNVGNLPLQFTGSPAYSASGNTADFQVSPSVSNGCSGSPLAAGYGCSISGVFAPVALGSFTDKLTFPSNAANAATAAASFLGTGVNLANSNLSITSSPAATASISYGAPVVLTFALSQSGTLPATGTILLQINGIKLSNLNVVNGAASYTFTPQAGTFVVAGQYSGDANYASSYATLTLTVIPAGTATKLAYSGAPLSVTGSAVPAYTLTANVTSVASGVTGVVSFSAGTTVLGMTSLNSSGIATLMLSSATASNFAFNNPVFTATYLGGANFATSTSNNVTVPGDFGLAALATTLSEPQGAVASTNITVTPYLGLTGNVTFACSNLPQNSLCRFLPNVLTFAVGNGGAAVAQTTQLQLYTNVVPTLAKSEPPAMSRRAASIVEAGMSGFAGLLLFAWRGKKRSLGRRLSLVSLLVVMTAVASSLTGCAGTSYYNIPNVTTPTGTTVFTLTATSANGETESIQLTMIVGPS